MKPPWKKLFFWSSIGSLAVGATVVVARKKPQEGRIMPSQAIPGDCQRIYIWTEAIVAQENESQVLSREHYVLEPTSFNVWSVLEFPASTGKPNPSGTPVYHVTYARRVEHPGKSNSGESENERSRYYGTVSALRSNDRNCGRNSLARGATLEIRKCYVGGATNGVETGEIHRSAAPILNYRFEYGSEPGGPAAGRQDVVE